MANHVDRTLEQIFNVEPQWRIYTINTGRFIGDIQSQYLEQDYREKFYSGEASQGGRIIDVNTHIIRRGNDDDKFFDKLKKFWNEGRLEHFNSLANGWYIWVVDEHENFVIGNRERFDHIRFGYKLPHPVLAKGKKVFGAGEVLTQDGLVKGYNTASGHYFDLNDRRRFNNQGQAVFEQFRKKAHWKEVRGGAIYITSHDTKRDDINF